MPKYILSPQAKKRMRKIRVYTLKNFGKHQKEIYMRILRDKMRFATSRTSQAYMG